jgi:hypothetical protein
MNLLRTAGSALLNKRQQTGDSDFDAAVTDVGITVTFKPTNSINSFYRLPERGHCRLGSVSFGPVRYVGPSGDSEVPDYGARRSLGET